MNEGSAVKGCWFESLPQGPMITYGPNTTCDGGGFKSQFSKPSSRSRPPGASIFRFDDKKLADSKIQNLTLSCTCRRDGENVLRTQTGASCFCLNGE